MSNNRDEHKDDQVEQKPTPHPHHKPQPGEKIKKPIQENPEDQNTG